MQTEKHHSNVTKISLILLLILLLGSIAGVAYLWNNEKSHNEEISSELNEKEKQVEALEDKVEKSEAKVASLKASQNKQADQKTSYSASVGQFTLTLPDYYYIIKRLDGQSEGGPATSLKIGEATSEFHVIDNTSDPETEVYAVPKGLHGPFNQWVKRQIDSGVDSKQNKNVTIDGVSAEHYTLFGLFETHKYFFHKNDTYYRITSHQAVKPNTTIDDVIQGFKFN